MKIKFLHIKWSGGIGGAERALYLLVKSQLERSDYLPAVAFAQPGGYYYDEIKKLGCEVIDLHLSRDCLLYTSDAADEN